VLFGLTLTLFSSIIGVAAGAVQGYYGGWVDLLFQRFMEIWSGLPTLYLLIILASVVEPNFWWLLGIMLLFSWMAWSAWCAPSSCARATSTTCAPPARWALGTPRSCSATSCPTPWWRR
jgi:ABC-type microcin C transport system permease subunit YejE